MKEHGRVDHRNAVSGLPLPRRRLGADGPLVGAVGLGCMGMSWAYDTAGRDERRSAQTIAQALKLGVTLIDTADMYGPFTAFSASM